MAAVPKKPRKTRGPAKNKVDVSSQILTLKDAQIVLGISRIRIAELVKEGWIKKDAKGQYLLPEAVAGYIAFWKDAVNRRQKNVSQNELATQRAKQIAIKVAKENRDAIGISEHLEIVENIVGEFLTTIEGMPAQITRNQEERVRLQSIFDKNKARLSKEFKKISESYK